MLPLNLTDNIDTVALSVAIESVAWPLADAHDVNVFVRRDDKIDERISGNKFYKLHGFLADYRQARSSLPIASFGGAYSNHLYALAALGQRERITTVAIVRGERPKNLSPTLVDCEKMGMRLHFVTRQDYKKRHTPQWQTQLGHALGGAHYWIPEGGAGKLGAMGAKAIGKACLHFAKHQLNSATAVQPIQVYVACGTATTFCGIVQGAEGQLNIVGVPVLKVGAEYINDVKCTLSASHVNWSLLNSYDAHGGYAKFPKELALFMAQFERDTGLLLDPVYTAKVFFALAQEIKANRIRPGSSIIVVHSGGLQGRRGFCDKLIKT